MSNASTTKPSALDALRGLAKKAAPATSPIAVQVNDPAIAGAHLAKKGSSQVILGFDPAIAATAERCAALHEALARAEAEFSVDQAAMRDYGAQKRGLYNDTYKSDVTTACVPFTVQGPGGPETRHVQVICSKKYSVQQSMVLGNKELLGAAYERMFVEETVKSLKPNAEELIRNVFAEVGLQGDELEAAMGQLFDEKTTVKARGETYEEEFRKLPDQAKAVLDQAVTRSAPALKFPG
jgi:hypothetical protein